MVRQLPVTEVRPTQLYLSSEKLSDVFDWFDFDSPNYDPLPAFTHHGEWYLSDGHTRAFTAWLAGAEKIRIKQDSAVRNKYDFDIYRTCIDWCGEAGIHTISDLSGRVVGPAKYETLWIDRCKNIDFHSDE